MIASAHIAAGFVIGVAATRLMTWPLGRVVGSFGFGVLLHLAMDAVPHADYNELGGMKLVALVLIESAFTFSVIAWTLRDRMPPGWKAGVLAGLLGSGLPDIKFIAPFLSPDGQDFVVWVGDQLHTAIHAGPTSLWIGMTTQLTATVVLMAALTLFPRTRLPARSDGHADQA